LIESKDSTVLAKAPFYKFKDKGFTALDGAQSCWKLVFTDPVRKKQISYITGQKKYSRNLVALFSEQ